VEEKPAIHPVTACDDQTFALKDLEMIVEVAAAKR